MGIAQIDGEDLNNEQMIALLQDAEQRLRAKQSNAFQRRNDAPKRGKPVRLKAHNLPKPYVSTKSGVAKLDRSRVRSEEDHKLASSIKKVEDPVLAKEKKLKVRYIPIRPNNVAAYEEIKSEISSRSGNTRPVMGLFCYRESTLT